MLLGDRVGVAPLAPGRRPEVPLLLDLRAAGERDRRPPRDVPERARGAAPLLLDQHLLERVEPLATVLRGVVDRVEAGVEHGLLRRRGLLRRQAVVLLARVLERDQHVVGERPGATPEAAIGGVQAEIHVQPSCIREEARVHHARTARRSVGSPPWVRTSTTS